MLNQDIVLAIKFLLPNSEFSFIGTDLETIVWDAPKTGHPTKEQILAAIVPAKAALEQTNAAKAADKAALLNKLGITAEEAALLLG